MRPVLFVVPLPGGAELPVPAYGTFLMLGMVLAVVASRRHAGRLGLSTAQVFDLGLLLVAAGVLAAHLLHVALHPEVYAGGGWRASLTRMATVWRGGLVYYGGLLGGLAALALWSRRRRLPFADAMDFVAPLGALGLASTRLGCFLNGCCYGRPSGLPWAVSYPAGSPAQQKQATLDLVGPATGALPIHPVQLYELVAAALLFVWLWRRFPRRRYAGEVVALFGLGYGTWRLVAEALRADAAGWAPGALGWTPMQSWSVGLIALSAVGLVVAARVARPPFERRDDPPVVQPVLAGPRRMR